MTASVRPALRPPAPVGQVPVGQAPVAGPAGDAADRRGPLRRLGPGLGAVAAITAVAWPIGHAIPVVGAPVTAIVAGLVVAAVRPLGPAWQPGLDVVAKKVLQWSIVLLGTGLSLSEVASVGVGSLPVLAGTLAAALLGTVLFGRWLRVSGARRTLIGVGTAICGASAIAAVTAVTDPDDVDVTYAMGTIFTFNVIAVVAYPAIGHLLGMSQHAFGLWSGTAINDTSSVVAAATTYGHQASTYGVVVKLTRTLVIIPIVVVVAVLRARRARRARGDATTVAGRVPVRRVPVRRVVPWFIAWFLVAATLDSLGVIPAAWHHPLSVAATLMITAALAAIGLSMRVRDIRSAGPRPLMLGAALWALVGGTSLAVQAATGLH